MSKKVIRIGIIVANEADELQVITPIEIWKKAGYIVELISLEKKNSVILKHEVKISCNGTFDKINLTQFNAIYIPGGDVYKKLLDVKTDQKIRKILEKDFTSSNKYIFANDESVKVLVEWNLLKDRPFTGPEEFKSIKNYTKKTSIVNSKGLITSTGKMNAINMAVQIVEMYSGKSVAQKVLSEIK